MGVPVASNLDLEGFFSPGLTNKHKRCHLHWVKSCNFMRKMRPRGLFECFGIDALRLT